MAAVIAAVPVPMIAKSYCLVMLLSPGGKHYHAQPDA
jgi:hypothetical protein